EVEDYHRRLDSALTDLVSGFDALVIVGGSGPIVDLANNERLHEVVLGFVAADKPILAECYGVAVLAFARDLESRTSLLWGKHVTGHPKEYDYKDGTGF
ncbi:type 1 glutamine amidotransferase domain-containing protein, partial [Streptomyces sp. SID625]|nr:type 1 glutamine amidotransferase domain-containing protein [Streptomyces sp. SID625]